MHPRHMRALFVLMTAPLTRSTCVSLETVAMNEGNYDCNGAGSREGEVCCSLKCPADQPDCVRIAQVDACPERAPTPSSRCPADFPSTKQCRYNLHCADRSVATGGEGRRRASIAPDFTGCIFTTVAQCDNSIWMVLEAAAGGGSLRGGGGISGGGSGSSGDGSGGSDGVVSPSGTSSQAQVVVQAGGRLNVQGTLNVGSRA